MKAALFDLDGVLVDTEGIYSQFWGEMGRRHNVGVENFSDIIKGTTLHQILNGYFPAHLHEGIIAELNDFEQNMPYRLFDGTIRLLDELRDAQWAMAIVTSSGDLKLDAVFAQNPGFRDYFTSLVTDSKVTRSKPDPQGYLIAASELGVPPADCYVFEDSYNGLLAGRRSGAHVIGIASTNPADTLTDKADLIAPTLASITLPLLLDL